MSKVLIYLIRLYQKMPVSSHNNCRFIPTCSNYMIEAIEEYGSIKGTYLGIKRILRCHPFNKNYGYDPVIKKGEENEKENIIIN